MVQVNLYPGDFEMFFILQEPPADTLAYFIAGYAVIFGVLLIYLASLAIRARSLRQDLDVLADIEGGEELADPLSVPLGAGDK
jgi:hypothetical protein